MELILIIRKIHKTNIKPEEALWSSGWAAQPVKLLEFLTARLKQLLINKSISRCAEVAVNPHYIELYMEIQYSSWVGFSLYRALRSNGCIFCSKCWFVLGAVNFLMVLISRSLIIPRTLGGGTWRPSGQVAKLLSPEAWTFCCNSSTARVILPIHDSFLKAELVTPTTPNESLGNRFIQRKCWSFSPPHHFQCLWMVNKQYFSGSSKN